MFERMLAACEFQLAAELEPLDKTLDRQLDNEIQTLAAGRGRTSLSLLSLMLMYLTPRLVEADVPFAVDGVAGAILYGFPLPLASVQVRIRDDPGVLRRFARQLDLRRDTEPDSSSPSRNPDTLPRLGYIYDLRDPEARWLAGFVPVQVRTQFVDPLSGTVAVQVRYGQERATVQVVPLHRLNLPRRYARALERMRQRYADLDIPITGRAGATH